MASGIISLGALLKHSTINDPEEILEVCDATLKRTKDDLEAQHYKVVALLKLDRFDDAIRVLEEGGERLKRTCQLEHAYTLYKLGELDKARALATMIDSRGAMHIEAQAV